MQDWLDFHMNYTKEVFYDPDKFIPNYREVVDVFGLKSKVFESVADFGCGPLPITRYPYVRSARFKVLIDPNFIHYAQSGIWPQTTYDKVLDDTSEVPDEFFTSVFCLNTLNYVSKPIPIIHELTRITDHDGEIFVSFDVQDMYAYRQINSVYIVGTMNEFFKPDVIKFIKTRFYYSGIRRPGVLTNVA